MTRNGHNQIQNNNVLSLKPAKSKTIELNDEYRCYKLFDEIKQNLIIT